MKRNTNILFIERYENWHRSVPVALIRDGRLSLEARALACFLLSNSELSWELRASALPRLLIDATRRHGHVGRDATRRMLTELQNCGYLVRTSHRTKAGEWEWRSVFLPVPRKIRKTES